MSSKDDALRRKKKQEKISNELLGISNVEYEAKEKKKPQQEQFKKKCGRCNKTKLLLNFGEDKRFSDNLKSICNLCEVELEKEAKSKKVVNTKPKPSSVKVSSQPKVTPKPKVTPEPESISTEKSIDLDNSDSNTAQTEFGFFSGLFAIGIVVGAIYLVIKIFGAGIDFVSSFFDESPESPIVTNERVSEINNQIISTDFCTNWEKEITTIKKSFLSREVDLMIELEVYKTCINNQIIFKITKFRFQ